MKIFRFWFRLSVVPRLIVAFSAIIVGIGLITCATLQKSAPVARNTAAGTTISSKKQPVTSTPGPKPTTPTSSQSNPSSPTTSQPGTTNHSTAGSSGTNTGSGSTSTSSGSSSSGSSSTSSGSGSTSSPSSYPDAGNTGPSGCTSYTNYSGTYTITTDGTVVSCLNLTGTLDVEASNITIQNSILTGNSWWGVRLGVTNSGATNLKLSYDRLQTVAGQGPDNGGYDYGVAPNNTGYVEVAYSDISGYKDGVDISTGYIHDNYIHGMSQFSGAHTQDVYVYAGGSGVQIDHNTLINDSPISQATAAVYIAPDSGHQNNVSVTNNKLAGGANALYGGDSTATNIVVKNNAFSIQIYANCGYYGTDAYWQASNAGNVWSGNIWADGPNAGQSVSP